MRMLRSTPTCIKRNTWGLCSSNSKIKTLTQTPPKLSPFQNTLWQASLSSQPLLFRARPSPLAPPPTVSHQSGLCTPWSYALATADGSRGASGHQRDKSESFPRNVNGQEGRWDSSFSGWWEWSNRQGIVDRTVFHHMEMEEKRGQRERRGRRGVRRWRDRPWAVQGPGSAPQISCTLSQAQVPFPSHLRLPVAASASSNQRPHVAGNKLYEQVLRLTLGDPTDMSLHRLLPIPLLFWNSTQLCCKTVPSPPLQPCGSGEGHLDPGCSALMEPQHPCEDQTVVLSVVYAPLGGLQGTLRGSSPFHPSHLQGPSSHTSTSTTHHNTLNTEADRRIQLSSTKPDIERHLQRR